MAVAQAGAMAVCRGKKTGLDALVTSKLQSCLVVKTAIQSSRNNHVPAHQAHVSTMKQSRLALEVLLRY